jgi:hypothetical protein
MATKVIVEIETGYFKYPFAKAIFYGTNIARFWRDPYLKKSLFDSAVDAKDDKDIFDFCNLLFANVDKLMRRKFGGQEVVLESVEVIGENALSTIVVR